MQILLSVAGLIVGHYLKHVQAVAAFFGVVLGLLAWFGLQSTVTVYVVEADVVRTRHLWPRSITQPPLTKVGKEFCNGRLSKRRAAPNNASTSSSCTRPAPIREIDHRPPPARDENASELHCDYSAP